MSEWNVDDFVAIIQDRIDFSVVIGKPLSGKTFICKLVEKNFGFKVIDMKALEDVVKKKLGTEEEPFEG